MRKLTYLAILEKCNDGYGVYFPDLPGCASFGESMIEAIDNGKEALELHIHGMEKDGDDIPSASQNLDLETDIIAPISVFPDFIMNDMENRKVKMNITIPLWLKEKAEVERINLSELLEVELLQILK
ncbi:MAG: type II toxin-antitoxin system HicB family antitoxin [Erysipelotrichaceae bacterium]|uniref:type II toxin-antitoxin system HicB family antitoxin n=1 Tax=Anaerorhabdus sp. TaxID=1872524 RepID=UPI002FC70742